MDYYISVIKDSFMSLAGELGWLGAGIAAAVVIAALVMFGRNVRWKR